MRRYKSDEELCNPYRRIRKDGHYIPEHRYIMSQILGRPLKANEVVHHINGNKLDNRPENLQVMDSSEHLRQHAMGRHGYSHHNKSVEAYSVSGELVFTFASMHEAARAGFDRACITKCLSGAQNTHKGLIWKQRSTIKPSYQKRVKRRAAHPLVLVKDAKTGKPVAIYKNPTVAHKVAQYSVAHIVECCKGARSTHKGMCFTYITEATAKSFNIPMYVD